jgi:hypothetical protein
VIPSQPLPAKTISKSVVNQFYTAIAFVIEIIESPLPPSPLPPSPLPPPTEPLPPEPLPYCDTPEAEGKKSCHDIADVDEVTGLFPCNDGSQASNKEDCPGYTEPEPEPTPEPEPDPGNGDNPVDSGVDEGNNSEEEVSEEEQRQ